ncbi:MAG TPA: ATP-binding cassette domain-containing protein [Candidatus Binatia bacterium]|nr:ATP-binding cassette domain-containing protein [Candidatus Binatia bacterium]
MSGKTRTPIIEAHALKAVYGTNIIWNDAEFEVKKGQFVGVLGPNGAGKTTLFKLILGILPTAGGHLRVFGRQPSRGNRRIGYVPQRHLVDKDVRLESLELVRLGLGGLKWGPESYSGIHKESEQAMAALKSVDAEDLAHRPLGILSGGELQRVFIAQALIGKPDLLLLDEPLANLDIRRQTNMINLIAKIARENSVTILLIAHDINPLLPSMDKVIYMANGQVASGRTEEVINSATLSRLYDAPVEVLKDSRGRLAVLGAEEAAHPHG